MAEASTTSRPRRKYSFARPSIGPGFRRLENEGKGENWEYYVMPEAWRGEVCAGFDAVIIAKAMIARKWMVAGGSKHLTREIRVPGVNKMRLYCVSSSFFAGGDVMSARKLHRALARLRELSPPVATTESSSGDNSAGGEIQAAQGFGETVATVATVSTEFVARSKISTCGHERSPFDGCTPKTVATGGDSGDSQEPRGFPLSPSPKSPVATAATTAHPWTDRAAWCARLGAAGVLDNRRHVLRDWVEAAGGSFDATAVYLPDALPHNLALATLKAHARALELSICSDPGKSG